MNIYHKDIDSKKIVILQKKDNIYKINKLANKNSFFIIEKKDKYSNIINIANCLSNTKYFKLTKEGNNRNIIFNKKDNTLSIKNYKEYINNNKNKLKINNILQGPTDWTFKKILKNFNNKDCVFINTVDKIDEPVDLYIKWRNHYFNTYNYKNNKIVYENILKNKSNYDKTISFIHDDLNYNSNVIRSTRTSLNSRKKLVLEGKSVLLTSINQLYTILNDINMKDTSILYSSLNPLYNYYNQDYKLNNILKIGYPFKFYNDNIKNHVKMFNIIENIKKYVELYIFTENMDISIKKLLSNYTFNYKIINGINIDIIKDIDLILITSFQEGSPLPLYEGIISNKYIVGTNCGNLKYLIPDYYLDDPYSKDIDFLSKQILNIKNNKYYKKIDVKTNYDLLKKRDITTLIYDFNIYLKSEYKFCIVDNKNHRKSKELYYFLSKKYKCIDAYHEIKNNNLTNFINNNSIYYYIIWNGLFEDQKNIINILYNKYKEKLYDRLIIVENGYFDQYNTIRLKKPINYNLDDINFKLTVINSFKQKELKYSNKHPYESNNKINKYKDYYLCLMQLEHDTVFKYNSNFNSNNEFIELIINNIKDKLIIFKIHPLDKKKYNQYKSKNILFFNKEYQLYDLIYNSYKCITINSSTHYDVLMLKKPLITLGIGTFTKKGVSLELNKKIDINLINNYKPDNNKIDYYILNINSLTYNLNNLENEFNNIKYNIILYWNIL